MMDFAELIQSVWSLAASALGALLAGIFGVRWQFQKLRRERAFDKQVAWYHELFETITSLRNRAASLELYKKSEVRGQLLAFVDQLMKLAYKFQELALHAELYAHKDTHAKVVEVINALNALAPKFLEEHGTENGFLAASMSMTILDDCSRYLARDMRQMLGLEELDEHSSLPRRT